MGNKDISNNLLLLLVIALLLTSITGLVLRLEPTALATAAGKIRLVILPAPIPPVPPLPIGCAPLWECTNWSVCYPNGTQSRVCVDVRCRRPDRIEIRPCVYVPKFIGDLLIIAEIPFTLFEEEQATFTYNRINYTIMLTDLHEKSVELEIFFAANLTLAILETKSIDLDKDGVDDIHLTLDAIKEGNAYLTIRLIPPPLPAPPVMPLRIKIAIALAAAGFLALGWIIYRYVKLKRKLKKKRKRKRKGKRPKRRRGRVKKGRVKKK